MTSTESILKKRGMYLALFCVINFFTGILYAWSVFSSALVPHLNTFGPETPVTMATLGSVFGLATAMTPITMLVGGYINDRFGPKKTIMVGGLCLAVGYLTSALATSVSTLYLTYGLLAGAGTGLVNGCTINSAVKFFPDKRGFAGGLVTACLGVGGALIPFAANALIAQVGIVNTLVVIACVLGCVIVGAAIPLIPCPSELAQAFAPKETVRSTVNTNYSWKEMLVSPRFYPLFALFAIASTMGLMMISNISGIAKTQIGMNTALAALSVSALSLANTSGRFLSGTLSDKLGRIQMLTLMLFVAMGALGLLYVAGEGDTLAFFTGIVGVGLCYGAFFGTYPGLVADEFGLKNNSVNFSVMAFAYSIGGFAGPLIIRSVSTQGNYSMAYLLALGLALLGLLCAVWFIAMKRKMQLKTILVD